MTESLRRKVVSGLLTAAVVVPLLVCTVAVARPRASGDPADRAPTPTTSVYPLPRCDGYPGREVPR